MRRQALPLAPCSSSSLSSLAALPPLLQKASEPTHFNGAGSGRDPTLSSAKTTEQLEDVVSSIQTEANVVGATFVFVTAIVLDAMNSLPTTIVQDVPTSLRTTSLVLISCLASPPVTDSWLDVQRLSIAVALFAAAIVGRHHAGAYVRVADGIYTAIGGWCTAILFVSSAGRPQNKGGARDARTRRENLCILCASFLFYVGLRICRAGFTHAREVTTFTISHSDFSTRGYGLCDDILAVCLCFGGAMCVCASSIALLHHDLIFENGSSAMAGVVAMCGVFVFTAAFVAQLAVYARIEDLPSIFGKSACSGSRQNCEAAYRARRFFMSNGSSASMWATAVGMAIFSFPRVVGCESTTTKGKGEKEKCGDCERREFFKRNSTDLLSMSTGSTTVVATLGALVAIFLFRADDIAFSDWELVLLYVSIPTAWFGGTALGAIVHVLGQGM